MLPTTDANIRDNRSDGCQCKSDNWRIILVQPLAAVEMRKLAVIRYSPDVQRGHSRNAIGIQNVRDTLNPKQVEDLDMLALSLPGARYLPLGTERFFIASLRYTAP